MKKDLLRAIPAMVLTVALASCQAVPQPGQPPLSQQPAAGATDEREVPRDLKQRYIYQVIYDLRDSFVAKDVATFMKHVSGGFYQGHSRLKLNLERTFSASGKFSLSLDIKEVEIDEERVSALITWRRIPILPRPEAGAEVSGTSHLFFHVTDRISLVDFEMDPLFGVQGF